MPAMRILGATALAAALFVYIAWAAALADVGPGLHYDEALFQVGAVHMLATPGPPTFTRPQFGWIEVHGRYWPLMVMPYAGAIGDYLLLPVFALFGPNAWVARMAAALLAAVGLWGIGRLAGIAGPPLAGAVAVLLLAVHPGLLSNSVFNDSGFAYWMAALGACCLGLHFYLRHPTALRAAILGVACGAGVWTRLNFAWLLGAAAAGALVGFGRRAVPSLRHVFAAGAGAVIGAAPLIGFMAITRFSATLDFMSDSDAGLRGLPLLTARLRQLGPALLYDDEHRRFMWDGPALPAWQPVMIATFVGLAVLAAFAGRGERGVVRWHRAVAVCLLVQTAILLLTRLPVREHHLLTLVPLAALCVVLAACRLVAWIPAARWAVAAVAVVYLALAVHWDLRLRQGLAETGGTGVWSDASTAVAHYLDGRPGPRVRVFDWGFDTSIQVVTAGRVRTRELFWPFLSTKLAKAPSPVWQEEIVPGGVYVTHAEPYLSSMGVAATARFRKALARSGRAYATLVFNDRRGRPNTEVVEIAPD